jgi:phosphoribosyl-ATP pyrophosphohydrolase
MYSNIIEAMYIAAEAAVLITAAKVDDLKAKYPDYEEEIDEANQSDPTPNKKYIEWAAKQIAAGEDVADVIDAFTEFHDNLPRLAKKDIYQYKTVQDVISALSALGKSKAAEKADKRAKAKKDAVYLYSDDDYLVVHPFSMDASCHYGLGTKWCISAKMSNYFDTYSKDNKFFYFVIDKKQPPKAKWSKVAVVLQKGNRTFVELYDAEDKRHGLSDVLDQDIGARLLEFTAMAHRHMLQQPDTWQYTIKKDDSPAKLLEIFNNKKDVVAVRRLLASKNLPVATLLELAKDEDEKVREAVASSSYSTPAILEVLIKDESDEVFDTAASNTKVPLEALEANVERLIKSTGQIRRYGEHPLTRLASKSSNQEVLRKLSKISDEYLQTTLAENKSTPEDVLSELADSEYKDVVETLVQNTTNEDTIRKVFNKLYSKDKYHERYDWATHQIFNSIAANKKVPSDIVDALFDLISPTLNAYSGKAASIVSHPNLSADRLEKALGSDELRIRAIANPNVTPDVLADLAHRDEVAVKEAVAENPSIPETARNTLVEWIKANKDSRSMSWDVGKVAVALAVNPSTPKDVIKSLLPTSIGVARAVLDKVEELDDDLIVEAVKTVFLTYGGDGWAVAQLVNDALEKAKTPEVVKTLTSRGKDALKQAAGKYTYRVYQRIVSLAEEKPELVPDESLAVIAKGARSGPALEAKNILLQRNPPAPKRTRRQPEPVMTPAEVEAHVSEIADVMHMLGVSASALLAIEEAAELLRDHGN